MPTPSSRGALATLEQILPSAVRAHLARYGPFLLFLGLLVFCGYLAARLSWQFAAPSVVTAPLGTEPVRVSNGAAAETPGDKIVAAHLFGNAAAPAASVAARNAPETSLDLGLVGVAADSAKALSYAIITNGGRGNEKTYAVGAALPDGALIREILPDRVVIAHNGRLETLRLPIAGTSILAAVPNAPAPNAAARGGPPPIVSQGFREQIQSHPHSLADYMRLRPYTKDGHLVGYRVYPGEKPKLFQKAGLVPGDVVTGVNGLPLNTPANSMKAMKTLRQAQGPVRLAILRQGHRIHVTINTGG